VNVEAVLTPTGAAPTAGLARTEDGVTLQADRPAEPVDALLDVQALQVGLRAPGGQIRPIVRAAGFTMGSGEVLALVGESGSGKSLTALALVRLFGANGLDPQLVAAGRAWLRTRGGERVDLLSLGEADLLAIRGREIGLIAQDPMSALNPVMRVIDQIVEARKRHLDETATQSAGQARRLLADAGFSDPDRVARCYPHQLSGGMRQRAMIAIALAAQPRLLIADEPTTALDAAVQWQVIDTLLRLRAQQGLSILFISHDLGVVSRIADRIAVMYGGQVVEYGPAREFLSSPAHPYTAALIDSLPRMTPEATLPRPIPDIPADPLDPPPGCAFHPRCAHARPGACTTRVPGPTDLNAGRMVRCHHPWGRTEERTHA
jgi:oligopeptide/dipeptide ABC transporter ATP-binding protein